MHHAGLLMQIVLITLIGPALGVRQFENIQLLLGLLQSPRPEIFGHLFVFEEVNLFIQRVMGDVVKLIDFNPGLSLHPFALSLSKGIHRQKRGSTSSPRTVFESEAKVL